ncbi:MAG: tRNA (guanosine(46)-N7)-methyltransferase TrmB [Gammaproteobacteria bacterium]|nr:tRNA (guanosine(46)-N7)-methyltransferase TrmB [Gammaproteobacteria bacterium]
MNHDTESPRGIRSFVIRAGRVTDAQRRALDELWPRHGIDFDPGRALDLDAAFGRRAPRTLEIGFGNGDNLAALAAAHPERDYLGIEVHRPGVGRLLLRAEQARLHNLRVVAHDAVEVLRTMLAPGTLDEALILFPDPWHKKRHHKRRLVQPPFIALLASRLRAGGTLALATDWAPYAEWMLEAIAAVPQLENLAPDGRFVPRPAWRIQTRFERRGERLGHEVFDLAFRRRADAPADDALR